ncbi:ABC transporter ATP-binding protein [Anaerolineaceae bacterium oral taxon 439]|nr:ABC transporter ATP-binding protein [Anaerolineaceae bacterium oral taxon 439]
MKNRMDLIAEVRSKNTMTNLLICLKVLFDLVPQLLVVHMISSVFTGGTAPSRVAIDAGLILACFILKAACGGAAVWKAHEAAYNALTDLRLQIIAHLKKLPLGFFQERKVGDLTNIVQHDVEQVEIYLAHGLPEIMAAKILPSAIFGIMLILDWRLAGLMIIGLPFMWLTKTVSAPLWKKNFKIFADSTKEMQENLMEYIAAITVIKAFSKEERKTEKTLRSAKDYVYWVKKSMAGISVPMGFIDLFMESGVVLVMIFGIRFLASGEISTERFILSAISGVAFTSSIAKTATYQHYEIVFNQAMSGIGSILNVPAPEKNDAATPVSSGDIRLSELSFAYAGRREAIAGVNIVFKQGSKNALVGASGSGKSTLANLMMRFWRPDEGVIAIAGRNIQELSERQVNSLFSIVQQDVFLFNLSMEENIRIGKPSATREEIIDAAKKARIHDFILSLPNGYETLAGEAGVRFSGGEKQRISIARMILKDAPILILDEATAAVDAENEVHIQAAIETLSRDKTLIVIAHRMNTIQTADQIVVMDRGTVIRSGTHESLLGCCELYRAMIQAQRKVDRWTIQEGAA